MGRAAWPVTWRRESPGLTSVWSYGWISKEFCLLDILGQSSDVLSLAIRGESTYVANLPFELTSSEVQERDCWKVWKASKGRMPEARATSAFQEAVCLHPLCNRWKNLVRRGVTPWVLTLPRLPQSISSYRMPDGSLQRRQRPAYAIRRWLAAWIFSSSSL